MASLDERGERDGPEEDVVLIEPDDLLPANPYPWDARRMGVDRWSEEAALISMAANMDPAKKGHRIVAWLMLAALVSPFLATLWLELHT